MSFVERKYFKDLSLGAGGGEGRGGSDSSGVGGGSREHRLGVRKVESGLCVPDG